MKEITIDAIIPFLNKGWVAMDKEGAWRWFELKPEHDDCGWYEHVKGGCWLTWCFTIEPCACDWTDSLRRVE